MNEKHLPELEPCRSCEYLKYKQLEGDNEAKYYCTANCHHIHPCPMKKNKIAKLDNETYWYAKGYQIGFIKGIEEGRRTCR